LAEEYSDRLLSQAAQKRENEANSFSLGMKAKLINDKVWIYVESGSGGGYQKLSEDDPRYKEILLWIDNQRFVELLDWVYRQRNAKKVVSPDV
jgi:hypothetical protein